MNQDPLQLSKQLLFQIGNLIEGNQVSKNDLKAAQANIASLQANLVVYWKFSGNYTDDLVAGGRPQNLDYGRNQTQFLNYSHQLCQQASTDKSLRQDFLQNLITDSQTALNKAENVVIFHRFRPFSVSEDCTHCHGKGKVRCHTCSGSGKTSCSSCGGSGRLHRQVPIYREGKYAGSRDESYSCGACWGSGKNTCSSCSGQGVLRCQPCHGSGYFIRTRQLYAQATPSYKISTNAPQENEQLEQLLNQSGIIFCAQKMAFDFVSELEITEDLHKFNYQGESYWLAQSFSIKDKNYCCIAFSNPPYPYIRPAFFDDLFKDELTFLEQHIGEKKQLNRKGAFDFFSRYAGQPVLDSAMRNISTERKHSSQDMSSAVLNACQHFISYPMAKSLGSYLNKIMDRVSPTYAAKTWNIIKWIGAACIFSLVSMAVENSIERSPIGTILGQTLLTAIICFGLSAISLILSWIFVSLARRKIPKEYQQRMRNSEPFQRTLKTHAIALVLGLSYGYGASQYWLPSWHSKPLLYVLTPVCQIITEQDKRPPNFCRNIDVVTTNETEISLSETEKIRKIQQALKNAGYTLSVDGKFGQNTEKFVRDYLQKNGIYLQKKESIENYYLSITKLTES